jgi:hypothetical protein
MVAVFWMSKLKSGVAAADYEAWVQDFDYEKARELTSIRSYRTYRIDEPFFGPGSAPFDYLEVIEVTNLDEYRRELNEHPAAQAIAQEWGDYVELVHSLSGELIPPGVSMDK